MQQYKTNFVCVEANIGHDSWVYEASCTNVAYLIGKALNEEIYKANIIK